MSSIYSSITCPIRWPVSKRCLENFWLGSGTNRALTQVFLDAMQKKITIIDAQPASFCWLDQIDDRLSSSHVGEKTLPNLIISPFEAEDDRGHTTLEHIGRLPLKIIAIP